MSGTGLAFLKDTSAPVIAGELLPPPPPWFTSQVEAELGQVSAAPSESAWPGSSSVKSTRSSAETCICSGGSALGAASLQLEGAASNTSNFLHAASGRTSDSVRDGDEATEFPAKDVPAAISESLLALSACSRAAQMRRCCSSSSSKVSVSSSSILDGAESWEGGVFWSSGGGVLAGGRGGVKLGGVHGGVPRGSGGGVAFRGDPGGNGGWNWKPS